MSRQEILDKWKALSDSPNSRQILQQTCFDALDYAAFNGLLTRDKNLFKNGNNKVLNVAPLTLMPSSYSKKHFTTAKNLQHVVNKMISNLQNLSDERFNRIIEELLIPFLEPQSKGRMRVDNFQIENANFRSPDQTTGLFPPSSSSSSF